MLPRLVESKSGKVYPSDSPQGKMIVNSPNYKNPFDNQSTALAPMDNTSLSTDLAPAGNEMSAAESAQAIFSEMADSLASIRDNIMTMVDIAQADTRGDSLNSANIVQDDPVIEDDGEAKQGFLGRMKDKVSMPNLKKMGIIALIAGVTLFADKLKAPLARMLEFFKNIYDRVTTIFGPDATLGERVTAFFGIFTDFGSYLLDIFDSLTGTIASWFGITFDPYDGLGSWIIGNMTDAFKAVKDWFTATAPKWLVDDIANIKDWVVDKVTGVFKPIVTFFTSAVEVYKEGGFTGLWEWTKDKILTAFKPIVTFFTGAVEAYKVDGASGVWDYVKAKIATAFEPIVTFFTGATEAWTVGGATGVWDYVKTKITDAFAPIVTFFKSESKDGGMFDFDGNPTILSWIVDKLKLPFSFLTDLFTFPETDEDGLFSFSFMGKVLTKFVDLVFLPWNLAINFLKGVFEWGEPDEKDEPFSLATLIGDVFKRIKYFFKDKLSFDIPKLDLPELPSISEMVATIVGAILPSTTGFIGKRLYAFDSMQGALEMRQMYEANAAAEVAAMQPVLNPSTSTLANQNAMLDASGGGVVYYNNSTNTSNASTTSDTYNQQELSSDHKEESGGFFSRVDWTFWN